MRGVILYPFREEIVIDVLSKILSSHNSAWHIVSAYPVFVGAYPIFVKRGPCGFSWHGKGIW